MQGDSGVFDVFADGQLVFSKNEKGRFPNSPDEVLALLARAPKA